MKLVPTPLDRYMHFYSDSKGNGTKIKFKEQMGQAKACLKNYIQKKIHKRICIVESEMTMDLSPCTSFHCFTQRVDVMIFHLNRPPVRLGMAEKGQGI